jgi:lipoate-protein ligase B
MRQPAMGRTMSIAETAVDSAPARKASAGSGTKPRELWVVDCGRVAYREALALQKRLCALRQARAICDTLLLLEHSPVYTLGRRTEEADLPLGAQQYRSWGIDVVSCDRGGRVTYHGPGQLVGYPIMAISNVHAYVKTMERALIEALGGEGVTAGTRDGLTGVWAGDAKIASIGVHVSRSVTTHGFAVNVDCDLRPFEWIVPCGIGGVAMTSVALQTNRAQIMRCFKRRVAWEFAKAFELRQRLVSFNRLTGHLANDNQSPETAPVSDR